jgi:hypothetical protein
MIRGGDAPADFIERNADRAISANRRELLLDPNVEQRAHRSRIGRVRKRPTLARDAESLIIGSASASAISSQTP